MYCTLDKWIFMYLFKPLVGIVVYIINVKLLKCINRSYNFNIFHIFFIILGSRR